MEPAAVPRSVCKEVKPELIRREVLEVQLTLARLRSTQAPPAVVLNPDLVTVLQAAAARVAQAVQVRQVAAAQLMAAA